MNIGFVSTRLAGVDGVSLETEKIARVLERMGHTCFYCAGELDARARTYRHVPRMSFNDPVISDLYNTIFRTMDPSLAITRRIYEEADALRLELEAFIRDFDIDLLFPQNASTIPMNLPLGIAIRDVIERNRMPTIAHHHDFYWERERFMNNGAQDILNTAFPPDLLPVQHLVINSIMQRRLRAWRGIDATYLPNVLDFKHPPGPLDDYAASFRETLGLTDDDVIVLQPTRVVRRKAIEKAVELVRRLDDDRLVLLITGYEGDEPGGYGDWLHEEAARAGIRYQFIADHVDTSRGTHDGHKVFTLWDIYPHADLVTYPSTYEGFGNGLLETIYFRKPFVVHRYPAYLSDIRRVGVYGVEFWHDITDDTLAETRRLIDDATTRERMVENNYAVAAREFSYERMAATLETLLDNVQFNGLHEGV